MASYLRLFAIVALAGVTLTGCARLPHRQAPTPPPVVAAEPEPVSTNLDEIMVSFRDRTNQTGLEGSISDARGAGFNDVEIAEAMGMAWLRAPRKRILISVTFVRFKNGSDASSSELDAAYEYGRISPEQREREAAELVAQEIAEREAEIAAAIAAAEEEQEGNGEEEEEPRRRSRWISWIPGL